MPKLLKYSLAAGLAVAVCWGAAIALWRYRNATPDNLELALWLIVLPLALLAGLFLLARRADAKTRANAQNDPDAGSQPASTAEPEFAVQEFILLAWNSADRLSDSAGGTLAMLPEAPGLDLDKELTDDGGFPIAAGRVAGIDAQSLRADLAQRSPTLAAQLDDAVLRATAILQRACAPLLPQVHAIAEQSGQKDWTKHLDIVCHTPADWPAEAISHLHAEIAAWTRDAGLPDIQIHTALKPGQDPLLRRFPLPASGGDPYADVRGPTLILSCASDISRHAVTSLAYRGQLYSTRHPKGLPPGEGAAAMLVVHAQQKDLDGLRQSAQLASSCVRLFLPVSLKPEGAAQYARIPADRAIPHLLDCAKADPTNVSYLAVHTHQDKPAMKQAFDLLRRLFPDLDAETGLSLTGASLGSLGCVATWHLAALAAEKTRQSQQPSGFHAASQAGMNVGIVAPLPSGAA